MNALLNNIQYFFQRPVQGLLEGNEVFWLYGLAVVLFFLILVILVWKIRNTNDRKKLLHRLKKMGEDILMDIEIPDGIENIVHLDCLLLTRAGILVIDIKDYAGMIFGAKSIDHWTQVLKSKSYKFDNPLFQNQERVLAVKSLAFGIPVSGLVLFTSAGEFPKGKPEGVSTPYTLDDDLLYIKEHNKLSSPMLDGWEQIKRLLH